MPKPRKMPGFEDPAKLLEKVNKEYVDGIVEFDEGKGHVAFPSVGAPKVEASAVSESCGVSEEKSVKPVRTLRNGVSKTRRKGGGELDKRVLIRVTERTRAMLDLYRSVRRGGRDGIQSQYEVMEEAIRMYVLRKAPELKPMIYQVYLDEEDNS
jgi:hypothetical protein